MDFSVRKSIIIFGLVAAVVAVSVVFFVGLERPKASKDISDWKTYRNEEYGFEFKYPAERGDIGYDEKENKFCTPGFCVNVSKNEDHLSFFGLRKEIGANKKDLFLWYMGVDGRIGYAYTLKDGEGLEKMLFKKGDEIFAISSGYRVDRDILSTFKFLK